MATKKPPKKPKTKKKSNTNSVRRMPPDPNDLTLAEEQFVYEYITSNGNATQAYLKAFPTDNPTTASTAAHNLMKKWKIQASVEQIRRQIRRQNGLSADAVVSILWDQADYYGADSSHAARVKAAEILGEIVGVVPDKRTLNVTGSLNHRHAHLHLSSAPHEAVSVDDLPLDLQQKILEYYRSTDPEAPDEGITFDSTTQPPQETMSSNGSNPAETPISDIRETEKQGTEVDS